MIIVIPEEDSIIKWKYSDLKDTSEKWKVAEISDLIKAFEERLRGEWGVEEIIEELESRKDYGSEYAQAMEDVIVILKAKFGMDEKED